MKEINVSVEELSLLLNAKSPKCIANEFFKESPQKIIITTSTEPYIPIHTFDNGTGFEEYLRKLEKPIG